MHLKIALNQQGCPTNHFLSTNTPTFAEKLVVPHCCAWQVLRRKTPGQVSRRGPASILWRPSMADASVQVRERRRMTHMNNAESIPLACRAFAVPKHRVRALQANTTPKLTTSVRADGLIPPKIAKTDGAAMINKSQQAREARLSLHTRRIRSNKSLVRLRVRIRASGLYGHARGAHTHLFVQAWRCPSSFHTTNSSQPASHGRRC